MQEVLSRSIGHLRKLQTPQQMAVWLYTVTRNRCWRMRRKSANAPAHMLSLEELMPDGDELGRLLADVAAGPESKVLAAEQHQLLHQAILRVPAALRIVLVLHDMEELSTEQVAQVLSLRQGTVRIRLHRARLSVRKEMSEVLDGISKERKHPGPFASERKGARTKSAQPPAECRNLFANLSEYLDGRIEPLTCEQMRAHIEACPSCVAFLRDLRAAIDRCRALEVVCNSDVAPRLRAVLTTEYLRLLAIPID